MDSRQNLWEWMDILYMIMQVWYDALCWGRYDAPCARMGLVVSLIIVRALLCAALLI
jgi:hypothetical protein